MVLKSRTNFIFAQWLAGIGVFLLEIEFGLLYGWASPAIPQLKSPGSPIPLNTNEVSWVVSLVNLGRLFGALIGPVLANFIGSKRCMCIALIPMALGWLAITLAKVVEWLYVARLSMGLGFGMAFSTFPLYLGEVAVPNIRGALISLAMVGAPFGQLLATLLGSFLNIRWSASLYFCLAVLLEILFLWLPESPHHLVKIGKCNAAKRSINWYRAGREVDEELAAVEKFVATNNSKGIISKLCEFKNKSVQRATIQIIALFFFMQICGLNSIVFYMESILEKADWKFFKSAHIVIFVSTVGVVASALSVPLMDRCGRKLLLLVSSSGVVCSMLGLTIYFWMMESGKNVSGIRWLPAASIILFIISFCVGLLPVPSTLLSEIFPANIKCIAACISGITAAFVSFLSSKTYQPMVDWIGEACVFMIYGICTVIVIPYTLLFVTETKGKSLQEIQDKFGRVKK